MDIVGFTTLSKKIPATKVASMLNRLYTKFDALSLEHDIFKVETIGDAYIAVANLVKEQDEDHAKRIAEFAIATVSAANETFIDLEDEEKGCVNIRVGFHSGPVVADVVGTRNLKYTLFGDTVNTASRMESNSEMNRIHCSQETAKLLSVQCPELPLKSRGKLKIKGKGFMNTFWVNEESKAPVVFTEEDFDLTLMDWANNKSSSKIRPSSGKRQSLNTKTASMRKLTSSKNPRAKGRSNSASSFIGKSSRGKSQSERHQGQSRRRSSVLQSFVRSNKKSKDKHSSETQSPMARTNGIDGLDEEEIDEKGGDVVPELPVYDSGEELKDLESSDSDPDLAALEKPKLQYIQTAIF